MVAGWLGVATRDTGPYIYIYSCIHIYIYIYIYGLYMSFLAVLDMFDPSKVSFQVRGNMGSSVSPFKPHPKAPAHHLFATSEREIQQRLYNPARKGHPFGLLLEQNHEDLPHIIFGCRFCEDSATASFVTSSHNVETSVKTKRLLAQGLSFGKAVCQNESPVCSFRKGPT